VLCKLGMSGVLVRASARVVLTGVACGGCSGPESMASGYRADASMGSMGPASENELDATSPDGARAADGADGGGGEAGADWCASQGTAHALCEDFDEGVPGKLTSTNYGGGIVAADVSDYVSAPESMWASIPALVGPHAAGGAFASFVTTGSHFELQADFQVAPECTVNADGVTLATLTFDGYSVALVAASGTSDLVELDYAPDGGLGASAAHPLASPVSNGVWERLMMDVNLSRRTASVTISGNAVLSGQLLSLEPPLALPASTTMGVGAEIKNQAGESAGCHVSVDDVVFDSL